MKKEFKPVPKFKTEDEECEFWVTADTSDYFDFSKPLDIKFPNLKYSTKTVSLRMTESLLDSIKTLANKKDVPYQSLMKVYLSEKVEEELGVK